MICQTQIFRHKRENLKKCTLTSLEGLPDFVFHTYPNCLLEGYAFPSTEGYLLLDFEGQKLTINDSSRGLVILDGTWKLAAKMRAQIAPITHLERRSLPSAFVTAYPRRQGDCEDPLRGLASIEAIYIAYHILGWPLDNLLDGYHWKSQFLEKNAHLW